MTAFTCRIPTDSDLGEVPSPKVQTSTSSHVSSLEECDASHGFDATPLNSSNIGGYNISRGNRKDVMVSASDIKTSPDKCLRNPPQVFNALLNSANILSLKEDVHENSDITTSNEMIQSKSVSEEDGVTSSCTEVCSLPSIITGSQSNAAKSSSLSNTGHHYSEVSDSPSSATLCYSTSGQLMQLDDQLMQHDQQPQQKQQQHQSELSPQQHHTYVLLQAPVDGDATGHPQMFLAMQTSQESSQHQYITLHPVTMDGNDGSMTMINTDSLNIPQNQLTSHGTSHVNPCDTNKSQMSNENSQVVLNLQSQNNLLSNTNTDQNDIHQSMVTYLQPLGAPPMQSQGQVLIAASDVQGNITLHNVQGDGLGARKILSGRSSGNAATTTNRRRLSTDPRSCEQCGRTFKYPSDLKKHLQIHTDIKKFRCEECSRCFRRLHQLEVHRRIHTGEKPYVCNRCGAQFRHDSTLTMHIRTRHDHLKPFSCDGCAKKFGRMSHLRKHQRNVCGRATMRSGALCVCKYCDVAFTKKADLKLHIISSCEKRPERTVTVNPLSVDGKDLMVPMYICDNCGKEFSRMYDYKRHQLTHSDDKPFLCPQCGKSFKERSSLNKHVKRMHCSDGDGTIPIDDDGININDDDCEDDELSCDEKDPTDIIVSIDGKTLSSTEQFDHNTLALAQAGIMANSNGQIITSNGQAISAADILNFPEVAAALGLNVADQSAMVDEEENTAILTIPSSTNLETSEVAMDIEQNISQEGSSAVSAFHVNNDGTQESTLKLQPKSKMNDDTAAYGVFVEENNFKQVRESGLSDHAHAIAQAEKAAAHDLLPEQILQDDENAQAALVVSNP